MIETEPCAPFAFSAQPRIVKMSESQYLIPDALSP
jgi:hypothetical protein